METNWYTSVVGVVGATIFLVTVLKRLLGNVAYVNTVPTWIYAVAISAGLTGLTNAVWHTLPGSLLQNMMQAVMMAGSASGFYEWLQAFDKPLASSAMSAGVEVERKNTPARVDLGTVTLPPPKTLTMLVLAIGLGAFSGCASMGGARHPATVSIVTAHAVLSAVQDGERLLVCGGASAPAAPACVPPDVHRKIAGELVTAFDLDGQVARLVRALPPGAMSPADVPGLLGRIAALIDRIFALIPASSQKAALAQSIGGK